MDKTLRSGHSETKREAGYQELIFETKDQVAVAKLNRPKKLNAINLRLAEEIMAVCSEVEADDNIRVLIFTGEGKGFCSGADVTDRPAAAEADSSQGSRLDELGWNGRQAIAVYRVTKPTIAAVNGIAAGAGMCLALACDIRLGSEKARFKTVFIERNLSPDTGMSYFLPRIVGTSRSGDLIFSSRNVGAEEAHRIGLLDQVVSSDELIEKAIEYAHTIARWPPVAMRSAKRVLQQNMDADFETALRNEMYGLVFAKRAPNDVKESFQSFAEKRPPKFTGT